jgi:hypothetical protein
LAGESPPNSSSDEVADNAGKDFNDMKHQLTKLTATVAIGIAALLAAAPAGAQTTPTRFNVPFAFLAGDRMHPAGAYVVNLDRTFHVLRLRSAAGANQETLPLKWVPISRQEGASMPGILRFRQYGSVLALRGIWASDARDGVELQVSNAEKELARANGGAGADVDSVFVR